MLLWLLVSLALLSDASRLQPQDQRAGESSGVVYFHYTSYPGITLGMPAIPLYCDGRLVARMKRDSFVGVRVPPGRHTFASKGLRTSLDETQIRLDVAASAILFVRLEVGFGGMKWWAHLRVVDQEDGRVMISKLDPLDAGHIDDPVRTTTAHPTVPRAVSQGPTPAEPPLTNGDIIALKRADLDDDIVLLKIRRSSAAFDLGPAGIGALREAGVSDEVIAAMKEASPRQQN